MRYKWYIAALFPIAICICMFITAKAEVDLPLLGKVIVIDPGHGGRDPGTMFGKIYEKDINLEISKVLEKELSSRGAIVYMIRNDDSDLSSIYDKLKNPGCYGEHPGKTTINRSGYRKNEQNPITISIYDLNFLVIF